MAVGLNWNEGQHFWFYKQDCLINLSIILQQYFESSSLLPSADGEEPYSVLHYCPATTEMISKSHTQKKKQAIDTSLDNPDFHFVTSYKHNFQGNLMT